MQLSAGLMTYLGLVFAVLHFIVLLLIIANGLRNLNYCFIWRNDGSLKNKMES
jgi:hypothetical protein